MQKPLFYQFSMLFLSACLFTALSPVITAQAQQTDKEQVWDERDLTFAFVTLLSPDNHGELGKEPEATPDLSDGDLLSGADVLKRLNATDERSNTPLLTDHALAAYIQHPVSGKSFELQIGLCKSLDFLTGPEPFKQQVQCGEDVYSYRAGAYGVEILINNEPYFDIPMDAGSYRLNGVDVRFKEPETDNSPKS